MFCIKKVCTYLISWTYADKLHTLKCIISFHNVQQHAHKKTSSKTGFTLVCHSFISYYIFLFKKCQTKIFLHFFSFMHYNRHEIKKPSRLLKREITRNSLSSPISRLFFYQTGGHMNTKNKLADIFCTLPKQLLQLFSASPEMLVLGIPALRIISISFVFAAVTILCGYFDSVLRLLSHTSHELQGL